MPNNNKIFLLIFLGMLTAFGPFVSDLYLPNFPSMVSYFHTDIAVIQLGLTFSMIGLAVGQLIFGPLSDRDGRKKPLTYAMAIFIATTIMCVFASNVTIFNVLRLLQGIAGAGGIVISRSIATDAFNGRELLKMLAVIGAINGIAPVCAPVAGGAILAATDWRGIFVILTFIGIVLLAGSFYFKESLPTDKRTDKSLIATFKLFIPVCKNSRLMLYVMQQGFAVFILFGNISSSPFIIQDHYGFSALGFSVIFGINAIAIGLASALSVKFKHPENCVAVSCIGMLIASIAEGIILYLGASFWYYEIALFILLFMMGFTFTASTTIALNSEEVFRNRIRTSWSIHIRVRRYCVAISWYWQHISLYCYSIRYWCYSVKSICLHCQKALRYYV